MTYQLHSKHDNNGRLTIGLIPENSANEHENRMRLGIIEAAKKHNVNLICFTHLEAITNQSITYGHEAEQYQNSHDILLELIEQFDIDGLLFLGWSVLYDGDGLDQIKRHFAEIPILSLGKIFPGMPSVYCNGGENIQELILHLIHKHDYRKIAFVESWIEDSRKDFYITTMKEQGLFDPDLLVSATDVSVGSLADRPAKTLSLLLDERKVNFDAIIVMRAEEARIMLELLLERGLRVPDDVCITSYEDDLSIQYAYAPMTTIYFPFYEIGYTGCERMIELLTTGEVIDLTEVPSHIVYRQSCGCKLDDHASLATIDLATTLQKSEAEKAALVTKMITKHRHDLVVEEFNQSLLNTFSSSKILDILEPNLELLDIRSCNIFLNGKLSNRFEYCSHIYSYENHHRISTEPTVHIRSFNRQKMHEDGESKLLIVSLLHVEKNYIGHISFEPGPWDGLLYLRLAILLSHAFIGTHMVDKLTQEIILRKEKEKQLSYYANFDTPTQLLNRRSFYEAISQIADVDRFYFCYMDMDGFKNVNDSYGHAAGDQMLIEISHRVQQILSSYVLKFSKKQFVMGLHEDEEVDAIFRMGGDEFIAIIPDLAEPGVVAIINELIERLRMEYIVMGKRVQISCSVGISCFPHDSDDRMQLVQYADMAMYRAKKEGGNQYRLFKSQMMQESLMRREISNHLRYALENNELSIHYQPQVDCTNGTIIGLEALLRWNHPVLGQVPPATFIPIAEESGLIVQIGDWVMRKAVEQMIAWKHDNVPPIRIAVNLSAIQFFDGQLVKKVRTLLEETGWEASLLEFEITENIAMKEEHISILHKLRKLGVAISVDDFGTHYSSLSYLKRFPVTKLKLDKSFIRGIQSDPKDREMIKAIIFVAKTFDLEIIAEGVELLEEVKYLLDNGCTLIQGYYYYKPMDPSDIRKILQQSTTSQL
ncbi:MAG: EAL domain-containing protein [Candidatus Cohnella colombiensis]|uniref:EAL domain-containing protein n=1 Tax=Candidatus Cohnella colombiensis TaxID=3121368 RepID=A0AA95JER2_9BACL|nr:MAG: EAL domain-containing protein [Cohnella sp.]